MIEPHPPVPEATPYAPKFLNAEAKREWNRMVAILMRMGLYTEVDRAALAMYCQAWGRWMETERQLSETGNILVSDKGNFYQNPLLGIANHAWSDTLRAAVEFGMTPSSRSRINIVGQGPPEPSLAEMLFGIATGQEVHIGGARRDEESDEP